MIDHCLKCASGFGKSWFLFLEVLLNLWSCVFGAAETNEDVDEVRSVPGPTRRTEVEIVVAPRAAPHHAIGCSIIRIAYCISGVGVIPIRRPLPDIARHVVHAIEAFSAFVTADFGRIANTITVLSPVICLIATYSLTPWICPSVIASGGFFPLGFGG